MGRRSIIRQSLIEDVHINLKKENRARSINKATSELIISEQEREMDRLKRKGQKMRFDTYEEMNIFFGEEDEDNI